MSIPNSKPAILHCCLHVHIQTLPNLHCHIPTHSSLGIKMSVPNGEPECFHCHLHYHTQTNQNIHSHVSGLSSLGFTLPVSSTLSDQFILPYHEASIHIFCHLSCSPTQRQSLHVPHC